ncbi:hypothetical protein CRG98_010910 [Punica granatum]|uniref:MULE transposase domain-containing protein n=1 Tax=Punica granatum TaxID=22663 RepID=A0A2I0KKY4_PUNGR|nr:hypothetical protein CRG98_010910 [Punica granatum]
MWYLLLESSLDDGLVDTNTDPEVMSMAEVGLKYEIVIVYTEADRMKDSGDDGMEAGVAGDGDEDDTDDDVWEVEDGEEDETEKDDSELGGVVISVDGCFLKTQLKGQLLSAVGRDGNNQMFLIEWAVVEGENEHSWKWFFELLMDDLGIRYGFGWKLISDQQKNLPGRPKKSRYKDPHDKEDRAKQIASSSSGQARKRMKKGMDEHVVQEAMNEHADIPSTREQALPSELEVMTVESMHTLIQCSQQYVQEDLMMDPAVQPPTGQPSLSSQPLSESKPTNYIKHGFVEGWRPPKIQVQKAKQPTVEQQIFKELNLAQKGVGVLHGESGMTYINVPGQPFRTSYVGRYSGQISIGRDEQVHQPRRPLTRARRKALE